MVHPLLVIAGIAMLGKKKGSTPRPPNPGTPGRPGNPNNPVVDDYLDRM